MDYLFVSLFELEDRFKDIALSLRDQQASADLLAHEDALFASLLSASLRTFAWIENQRNAVVEAIGEHFPLAKN